MSVSWSLPVCETERCSVWDDEPEAEPEPEADLCLLDVPVDAEDALLDEEWVGLASLLRGLRGRIVIRPLNNLWKAGQL